VRNAYGIKTNPRRADPVKLERIAAADLVLVARRVATLSPAWTLESRCVMAEKLRALALEINNAADYLTRGRQDPELPPIYRADGPELPERILLRAEADALIHD
jgi:hypothetical protein